MKTPCLYLGVYDNLMITCMCRMCDQTEGRGARIKSKLDSTSHDREKPEGEKLCLLQDMRSTGGFGVV